MMFELTALEVSSVFTGSLLPASHTLNIPQPNIFQAGTNSMSTGSWFGLNNTWGVSTTIIDAISSSMTASIKPGFWASAQNPYISWGINVLPTESIDRTDTVDDAHPLVGQSVGPGEWDPFPIPEAPPAPTLPQRDVTRYRKTYSSQRHQVQRIRIVRK